MFRFRCQYVDGCFGGGHLSAPSSASWRVSHRTSWLHWTRCPLSLQSSMYLNIAFDQLHDKLGGDKKNDFSLDSTGMNSGDMLAFATFLAGNTSLEVVR